MPLSLHRVDKLVRLWRSSPTFLDTDFKDASLTIWVRSMRNNDWRSSIGGKLVGRLIISPLWNDEVLINVLDTDRSPLNVGIPLVFMVESAFAKQPPFLGWSSCFKWHALMSRSTSIDEGSKLLGRCRLPPHLQRNGLARYLVRTYAVGIVPFGKWLWLHCWFGLCGRSARSQSEST